ncbi:MAG: GPW/gp25 family protein [Candidatus Electrothrix scaldis]|nr:MAG: GPW/gp25 family protein [Candidatus Electrothrix sp. GW3-3]
MSLRYQALRFIHPDFDLHEGQTGLVTNPDRTLQTTEGTASIRQAILMLLSTRPGERVMRPDYGCYLHRLLFSPNDDTTAGLAIHYVRRALDQWEPRIEILALDAQRSPENAAYLVITLDYRMRSTRVDDQLVLTMDLMVGES